MQRWCGDTRCSSVHRLTCDTHVLLIPLTVCIIYVHVPSLCAAVSGAVGYLSAQVYRQGMARLLSGPLAALSLALTAFLVYNVAAGGNPPKRQAAGDEERKEAVEEMPSLSEQ
jgi:hypothetical protein